MNASLKNTLPRLLASVRTCRRGKDALAHRSRLPGIVTGVLRGLPLGLLCAMCGSPAYALGTADFTNTGITQATPSQFEHNVTNNSSSVLVLPKGMSVSKSADASAMSSPTQVGDMITYSINVENLGLLGLNNVTPIDTIIPAANLILAAGDTNSNNVLDAAEIWQYQGTYSVTQADLDSNGGGDSDIDNTVTVTTDELPPMSDTAEVPITQAPAFTISKVVDLTAVAVPSTLNYTIDVVNSGNLTLTGLTLLDTMPDGSVGVLTGPVSDSGIAGSLDVGETWTYSASYNATQADIDAGLALQNVVSATSNETGSVSQVATASTSLDASPAVQVEKVVDQASIAAPGTLNYVISATNTGNVTLTGINLLDTAPDSSVASPVGPVADIGTVGALDVGETWTWNMAYAVPQAQIDAAGTLVNTVALTSVETGSTPVQDTAETEVTVTPSFTVEKVVDNTSIAAPTLLNYVITIANTGNVTLNNVVPVDVLPDGATGTLSGPVGDAGIAGALDTGESWQYSISYSAPQADIDNSADLVNTVTVTADETGPVSQSASATTSITTSPVMQVDKSVDMAVISAPGNLEYQILVSNTGNVSLTNVTLLDSLPDGTAGVLTGPATDTGVAGAIDVGETWEYSISYAVSQPEIDAGAPLINTITVTSDETGSAGISDNALTTIGRSPAFTVVKSVDVLSATQPGVLNYTITAQNTGNVTLTNIVIDDVMPDASSAILSGPVTDAGVAAAIDVGETWTWTAQYQATQQDLDAGLVLVNEVTVTTDEAGSSSDTAETTVSQLPGISLSKTTADVGFTVAGDVIDYSLTVLNSGNVALSSIVLSDPIADAGSIVCTPAIPAVLLPTQQITCSAQHTVTAADVASTVVNNQASVSSNDPLGNPVSDDSEVVSVPMTRVPPVATNNNFISPVSAVPVTLPAAADDTDANGDLAPASLSLQHSAALDTDGDGDFDLLNVPGEGTWVVSTTTGEVTFTPQAGFTADPTPVPYVVSDATALVSNQALLSIDYPQTAPVAKDDYKENPVVATPSNPTTVNVIADNGNGPDIDPENDLDIQSINFTNAAATDSDNDGDADTLIVAGEGSWILDNASGDVTFTPEAGFLADPTPIGYTISDTNGLISNEAFITVDYPQTAPVAADDQRLEQPLGQAITLPTLANDADPENNLDPTSVALIDPDSGARVTVLVVAGEGSWTVDALSGDITFTPEPGFITDPVPVQYSVFDTTGLQSNIATITITYEEPATLQGTVWLDSDRDGVIDADEDRKANWTLRIVDSGGEVVASTQTDENGEYLITGLIPGSYVVEFYNEAGVFMDSAETNGPLLAGETMNLPLPVDPSGIVYDSISRLPVAGVTLNLLNSSGQVIDESCLLGNQQGQITEIDGLYAFDIIPGAHSSCVNNDVYVLSVVTTPEEYHAGFSAIILPQGDEDCGNANLGCALSRTFDADSSEANCTVDALPATDACEIQSQPDAPSLIEDTQYYVEFQISSGDRNVIFNHLPIDAKANDAEVLLSKSVNKREVSIGSLVQYTLTAENTKDVPAFAVAIQDKPPAGFVFVDSSVQLLRAGPDAELGTEDDTSTTITANGPDPIDFELLDMQPLEILQIRYVMKVGTGVVVGTYVNRAHAVGPNGVASNDVTASVQVVADPVISQATLVGKVFSDRDADGIQDPAHASGIALKSDHYGWDSLALPEIPGRRSVSENPADHALIVNMPIGAKNHFKVVTREGTRISVDEDGTVTEAHIGAKARGLNGQDIRVCTRHTRALPTIVYGEQPGTGEVTDVVEIVLSNHGVNERGIPGVRLATVSGLLIETDAYGRYSIPDVDAGNTGTGANFILKVDEATLPQGSSFTTENPYLLRIVNSGLNKINFGVQIDDDMDDPFASSTRHCDSVDDDTSQQRVVEVSLGSVFFDTNEYTVRDDQIGIVTDIVSKLREFGGGDILIQANTDSRGSHADNLELAKKRANTIREILRQGLGEQLMQNVTVEVDPAAYDSASDREAGK